MECTSEHQVVIYAEFVEALGEVFLVDQTAGFVYYYQCKDSPGRRLEAEDWMRMEGIYITGCNRDFAVLEKLQLCLRSI